MNKMKSNLIDLLNAAPLPSEVQFPYISKCRPTRLNNFGLQLKQGPTFSFSDLVLDPTSNTVKLSINNIAGKITGNWYCAYIYCGSCVCYPRCNWFDCRWTCDDIRDDFNGNFALNIQSLSTSLSISITYVKGVPQV